MSRQTAPDDTDLLDALEPITLADLDVDRGTEVLGGYFTTGMSSIVSY